MKSGEKIKRHRIMLGMTQPQLAQEVGVSLKSVQFWEWGERTPRPEMMVKLAKLFDTSVEVLFFDESDRLR